MTTIQSEKTKFLSKQHRAIADNLAVAPASERASLKTTLRGMTHLLRESITKDAKQFSTAC